MQDGHVILAVIAGNLMVVALADIAGMQKVASFTLNNLYQPGDNIHTTYVEDTGTAGTFTDIKCMRCFVKRVCNIVCLCY